MPDDKETYTALLIAHLVKAHGGETVREAHKPCDVCDVYGKLIDGLDSDMSNVVPLKVEDNGGR